MNKQKALSATRHALTFLGGMAVMYGWADEGTVTEISGGVIAFVGWWWGWKEKNTRPAT